MRLLMVLAFVIVSLLLAILWPEPLPPEPELVRAGSGISHVQAAAINEQQQSYFQKLEIERYLRIGGAVLTISLIVGIAFRLGRRIR